jgi:hypothetical protein
VPSSNATLTYVWNAYLLNLEFHVANINGNNNFEMRDKLLGEKFTMSVSQNSFQFEKNG